MRITSLAGLLLVVGCGPPCGTDFCTENRGVGGGYESPASCASGSFTVTGALATPAGTTNAYDALVSYEVQHKRDVDPVEDGCIVDVTLTLRAGGQCELKVVAGGKKTSTGALAVKSVELTADSQCPGFLDAQEGVYEIEGGLTTAELQLTTATAPGRNVASSCLATTMTLKLAGSLNRHSDGAELKLGSTQLVISGQFNSMGDVMLKCPAVCPGNCVPQPYWEDPATRLKWEHPAHFALPRGEGGWTAAQAYCATLTAGAVPAGTWRMPTIDELRTLIRDNPATQTGGSCKVCTTCAGSCLASTCYGACDDGTSSIECAHAPPELGTACTTPFHLWSSTAVSDRPGNHWTMSFYQGTLFALASEGGVRCVR